MKRVFIAEKPSLAKAIAEALPPPVKKNGSSYICGTNGDDVVVWCAGHIMAQVDPDFYNPAFKGWDLSHLPIIPADWQLKITAPELYETIKAQIKTADIIVNAGDPDNEGQLLVDEVIGHIGTNKPIKRILVNDLNLDAVQKALSGLKDNSEFKGMSDAALGRSRADWLYGINMTRLYSLLGRNGGYTSVLSVGRVQTPLLGLVVRRDIEIENFKPKPFYTLTAQMSVTGGTFMSAWKPGSKSDEFLDEDGRLVSKAHAEEIEKRIKGKQGEITSVEVVEKKEQPPQTFALKDIQILASTKLNLSPDVTLEVLQSLYETHKIITYPRSDCPYLPEGHLADIDNVVGAIVAHSPTLESVAANANKSLRSKVWNDKKITAHHAIIPSPKSEPVQLSANEKAVYELIAFRYLLQFYPSFDYQQTSLKIDVEGELLTASGKIILNKGWKELVSEPEEESAEQDDNKSLPSVKKGDAATTKEVTLATKTTVPPKHFTDASLLEAMSGIARFVTNPEIKKLLKESDGIGTPATQASIIKTLFDRNYLTKKGKQVLSTPVGRSLIGILPTEATVPDMTAYWEAAMKDIVSNNATLEAFLAGVEKQLHALIAGGKQLGKLTIPGISVQTCPVCANGALLRRKSDTGFFWGCSNYPACKTSFPDLDGKPNTAPPLEFDCPACKKGKLRKKKGANGDFWGCSGYKDGCKQTFNDHKGKPDFDGKTPKKKAK